MRNKIKCIFSWVILIIFASLVSIIISCTVSFIRAVAEYDLRHFASCMLGISFYALLSRFERFESKESEVKDVAED